MRLKKVYKVVKLAYAFFDGSGLMNNEYMPGYCAMRLVETCKDTAGSPLNWVFWWRGVFTFSKIEQPDFATLVDFLTERLK